MNVPCQADRVGGEQAGGAHQAGHVHVVSAGVRDRHDLARAIGLVVGAGVRETGLLLHRQRVHVGADEHGGAVAVLAASPTTPVVPIFSCTS